MNVIVSCAQRDESCYGARMTGAGLGGCAVALVRADAVNAFSDRVVASYEEATGLKPNVYVCSATGGADVRTIA